MKVCFVCHEATRLFDPTSVRRFGGAATDTVAFARGLADLTDHEISFVLGTTDPRPPERFDDIQAYFDPSYDRRRGHFPWIRWTRIRPGLLWEVPLAGLQRTRERLLGSGPTGSRLYRHLDADVVVVTGVNHVSEHVVRERQGRPGKTLLRVLADTDLSESFTGKGGEQGPYAESAEMGNYILTHVDAVCVQTEHQQRLLLERFGRESTLVCQPIALDPLEEPVEAGRRRHVLWIGRADRVHKMPERCLALAEKLPELAFVMVMNDEQRRLWEELVAKAPANVQVVRAVPPEKIGAWYRDARAFVNTSCFEGFPNTYLEAVVNRVPYLTYEVDPGGVYAHHDAGFCANGDLDALAAELERAVALAPPWPARVKTAVRYAQENHAVGVCTRNFEALLQALLAD